ncbi:hypothetical protein [Neolewinella agarilytica]|uniref:Uncharacterized protein n=1 Tax=Neolewinella agarilytica TaxID=478744 RepID=A0A1H9PDL8_9BACT|nr:hypothetical protein [Neolewinella agarilytica]SER46267.1 hypothetical protein SAMN05444359_1472 [Neolewinella agarilytica]
MKNWLNEIISNLKSKRITQKRIREAYVLRDSRYLKKAYRNGRSYLKKQIVGYIGEISTQENFNFLLEEMKVIKDEQLKSFIYVAIMNIALNEKIQINNKVSEYLNQNSDLLNNIEFVTYKPKKAKPEPIGFRNRLKDHLGILEEMKKRNEIY